MANAQKGKEAGKTGWADPLVEKNRTKHINYWIARASSIKTKRADIFELNHQLQSKLKIRAFSRLATSMTVGGGEPNASLVILTFCPCKLVSKQGDINASYVSEYHGGRIISSANTVEQAVRAFAPDTFSSIPIFNAYTLPFRIERDNINRSSGLVYEHFVFYLRQLLWILRPKLVLCIGYESSKILYNLPSLTANSFSLCSAPEMGEMGEIALPSAKLTHRREEVAGALAKAMHTLRVKYISAPHPSQIKLEGNRTRKEQLQQMWDLVMPQVVDTCYVSKQPMNAFALMLSGKKVAMGSSGPAGSEVSADLPGVRWIWKGKLLVVPKLTMKQALNLHKRYTFGAWVTVGDRPHARTWFKAPLTRCKQIHFAPLRADTEEPPAYGPEELDELWRTRIVPAVQRNGTTCIVVEDDGKYTRSCLILAALLVLICNGGRTNPPGLRASVHGPLRPLSSVSKILDKVQSHLPHARFTPACVEVLEELARAAQALQELEFGVQRFKTGIRAPESSLTPGYDPHGVWNGVSAEDTEFKGARHIDILRNVAALSRFCKEMPGEDELERYLAMITNYSPADW